MSGRHDGCQVRADVLDGMTHWDREIAKSRRIIEDRVFIASLAKAERAKAQAIFRRDANRICRELGIKTRQQEQMSLALTALGQASQKIAASTLALSDCFRP